MPIQVLMPALSPTMEEGKLSKWLVKVGDSVASGDVIAEIETDKATMEIEAVDEGTIGRIYIEEGTDNVAINTPIAVILAEGEDEAAIDDMATPVTPAPVEAPATADGPADTQTTTSDVAAQEVTVASDPDIPSGTEMVSITAGIPKPMLVPASPPLRSTSMALPDMDKSSPTPSAITGATALWKTWKKD